VIVDIRAEHVVSIGTMVMGKNHGEVTHKFSNGDTVTEEYENGIEVY